MQANSKYVTVRATTHGYELEFKPTMELTCGSTAFAQVMMKRVRRIIKRAGWTAHTSDGAIIGEVPAGAINFAQTLADLDDLLERISDRVLGPHEVEVLLSITPRERIRWTKDQRLPVSGRGSVKRSAKIFFHTYPARKIMELYRDPDRIVSWRREDAETAEPPTG